MYVIILSAIGIALAVFLLIVAKQPADFRISRSCLVNVPPAMVFPYVNDLQQWQAWSPWVKLDSNKKYSFSGALAGTGANMQWAGNGKIGLGGMTITESRNDEFIRLRLEFVKPFKAINAAEFRFRHEDNQTLVCWCMIGSNSFSGKAINLIMNFDRKVGRQFEQGLSSLKYLVETARQQ